MNNNEIILKIPKKLFSKILSDLKRSHPFAEERIGFVSTKYKKLKNGTILIFATGYKAVKEEDYINDEEVGARINSNAIRSAMQNILDTKEGGFHVHYHLFSFGMPEFSDTDLIDNPEIVKSFTYVGKQQAHGMLVIGNNFSNALVQLPEENSSLKRITKIVVVGYPMNFSFPIINVSNLNIDRYDRQSFLGENSQYLIHNVKIGIVGLGGGGSHIVQQLAHIGIHNYNLFDYDKIDDSNLNRLVGAELSDIENNEYKYDIAARTIRKLIPDANIQILGEWQKSPEFIQECDIVLGCVDSFVGRRDLEAECRRYMIPYIDIGMDVYDDYEEEPPSMVGQVLLSMPESLCFTCLGFLNEVKLAKEAAKYGKVGGKPQVVWPNGILASSAVGIVIDLITGWTKQNDRLIYLMYDGNTGNVNDHVRMKYFKSNNCNHYSIKDVGPPTFRSI